jgi:two-component system phosphate regulon sensor histidine kinase PhoR
MMKKSLSVKLFTNYFTIILGLSILIILITFRVTRNRQLDLLTDELTSIAKSMKISITPLVMDNDITTIDSLSKNLGKSIGKRVTVIAADGTVLGDTERNPAEMENHRYRDEVQQALKGEVGKSTRFSRTIEEDMLYVTVPIEYKENIIGVLRVSMYLDDIDILSITLMKNIIKVALLMILLSAFIAFLTAKKCSSPLEKLAEASREIAKGKFNIRVNVNGTNELKDLAENFNYMAERIGTLVAQLQYEKEQQNSISESISEGIMLLDTRGKIISTNRSFKKFFHLQAIENKYYWEVLRDEQFDQLIRKIQKSGENFSEEMSWNNKSFLCSFSSIPLKGGIAVVFHDITEIKNLERVKKDFISNVSHELRTPLTAIKGFVETLSEEESDPNKLRYLEIIERHSDRLVSIVNDLLLLSNLEERESKLEIEKINIKSLIDDIYKIFEENIKQKNLNFVEDVPENLPPLEGDRFKLEQMLINLIDNAIKYTDRGEIKISAYLQDSSLRIEISDTGIGIPEKHVNRIFERFYVVDKSRSRKSGGTGLGLSIVKHILNLHNGKIEVESTQGVGTHFSIVLPLRQSICLVLK